MPTAPIAGWATTEGTDRYRQRRSAGDPGHFRRLGEWHASSIGLGTYLGNADDATDALYEQSVALALADGCNLLDTAINYRCQRSERAIGAALRRLFADGAIRRDEVVVCTKAGYLPFDGHVPADPARHIADTFLRSGLIAYDDVVGGCHCIAPSYLAHQLDRSLANLGVSCLDVYYLHNPEQQLDQLERSAFLDRIEAAFAWLEGQVAAGTIRLYGTATWQGLRANPSHKSFLSLPELVAIARRVGGPDHHFRVIQLPYNLAMPEAFAFANQSLDGAAVSTLEAAGRLGVAAVASASLLQQRLTKLPAPMVALIPGLQTDAQRALQFVRSTPGITAALVGMKQPEHAHENLGVARVAPMSPDQVRAMFARRT